MSDSVANIRKDISEIHKTQAGLSVLVDRIDITLEKLTDVSQSLSQLFSAYTTRLEYIEKMMQSSKEEFEKKNDIADSQRDKIYNKIEVLEQHLENENVKNHQDLLIEIKKLSSRVGRIEKWMWLVIGGGIVVGFLVTSLIASLHVGDVLKLLL